jgi:hypothetical protein
MGRPSEVVAMHELWIGETLAGILHLVSGDPVHLQPNLQPGPDLTRRPRRDHRVELFFSFSTLGCRQIGKISPPHLHRQGTPLGIVLTGNGDPLIGTVGWVHAVGHHHRIGVASASDPLTPSLAIEQGRRQEVCGCLHLGEIEILTFAGSPPIIEGCKQSGRREPR